MENEKQFMYAVSAAGRINLIGEHIDYCGGKVMPAALSLKNTVYIRPNGTDRINLAWTDIPARISLEIGRLNDYRKVKYADYPAGVAYMWQQAGHKLVGCDILQDCSVPFGSGLSSSAAIEVSTMVALATVAGETPDLKQVALLSQKAENEYCGVNCGIMDQFASAMGKKDHAILLDCKTLDYEYIPLDLGDYELVIANCNKPHALVESKYNERRAEVERALELLQQVYPSIGCLADLTPDLFERAKHVLSGKILDRATHVVYECARVAEAAEALKAGNIGRLAQLINASHDSLSKLYEVTGREPDALAYAARAQEGCIASRMIGAGFGGCTISLVEKGRTDAFRENVGKAYKEAVGYDASFYDTSIEDGVSITKLS